MNQLIKGCELAIHNTVFLTKEIEELKVVNVTMQQKLRRIRKQIVHTGSLTKQKAQALVESDATTQNVVASADPSLFT